MNHNRAFWDLIKNKDVPILVLEGGSGSSKTISILQRIIRRAIKNQGTITSVVSETLPQLKKGGMRDFFKILEDEKIYDINFHNQSDRIYSFGKSKVEFFSADNMTNVLGGRRDYLFINEGIRLNWDTAYTLMRYTNIQSIVDFNPVYEFWAHTDLRQMDTVKWFNYTFKDNKYLPEMQRKLLLERAKTDKQFERVFVYGLVGKREGLIYPDYTLVDTFPPEIDYCYGLDFGFNHPLALIKTGKIDNQLFWEQKIYKSGLIPSDIINLLRNVVPEKKKEIFADPSRPDLIELIYRAGFNIKKANNDVDGGISGVKNYFINITKESTDVINEIRQYHWKVDKNDKPLDEPVKIADDAMDGGRYGTMGLAKTKITPARASVP